ncbi:methyl-accepting chemotaxis protein [Desulfuromonas versatilis]|uniref:Methyl-accepting chemotaxis protein n=1 Tax=Desulfuromonas versatilis TaxID=2802975 RepID=A0ABN6E747_9BACT|nr:methyl-accepting chemotaxis protein [Desulfuromonas versatilis]BCR06964.1 methyl-accepting chemotaxis protein [Desulfuromonas versatilis]
MNWYRSRLSAKIVVPLILVLVVILGTFATVLVQKRGAALRETLLSKARAMALVGASSMERALEDTLDSGALSRAELFDTDYQRITEGPLAGASAPKYHTAYDRLLDERIQAVLDVFLDADPMVEFAVLVDRKGYLPTHNTRYSQPLTGDQARDLVNNRTKRIFDDPVGLAAARYDGSDGNRVLRQVYRRDTGEELWDLVAPVYVRGDHWGGFRIGFSIEQTERAIAELRDTVLIAMLLVLLAASLTIYLIVRRVTRPLKEVTEVAERIAGGKLEETIEVGDPDEIGQLAESFNRMTQGIVRSLKGEIERSGHLLASVKEAIQQLSSSSNEIMAISAQQSSGANQQASAVQEATTTSEEIAVTAKQVAENARSVEALAEKASEATSGGLRSVQDAVGGMGQLRQRVESISSAMLELGENSREIGGIVEIIDEISDQTNLLALNAAIEAAGAGEAGKRFSVVATEVQRLAERTVVATKQIKQLIEEIQKATNSTIMLTEEGTKGVDLASSLVAKISEGLEHIARMVGETTRAAREIKVSTQQQTSASEQMAETIAEVRDVAAQVADSAGETAQAIAELNDLAERLRSLVEERG